MTVVELRHVPAVLVSCPRSLTCLKKKKKSGLNAFFYILVAGGWQCGMNAGWSCLKQVEIQEQL